jgi:hypothetical protein
MVAKLATRRINPHTRSEAKTRLGTQAKRWRNDPIAFITEALVNPQTDQPFQLFDAELIFLRKAFTPSPSGDLPYRDILWSCIKKSGKSTFGALCLLYTVLCLGGKYAEAYVISNDLAQAQDRIFTSAARIIEASPMIRARITSNRITFPHGSFIEALPADYRGAAGNRGWHLVCLGILEVGMSKPSVNQP